MGFTQEKKINLGCCEFCQGCEERCKFDYVVDMRPSLPSRVYPTIGGQRVESYVNKQGKWINAGEYDKRDLYGWDRFRRLMIYKAHYIATLCDKYKAR